MHSWQYNEKVIKNLLYNHARDFGRFYCQLMLDSPLLYKEMIEGYYDELNTRFGKGNRAGGNDKTPPDKNGVP